MDPTTLNLLLGAVLALGTSTVAWVAGRRSGRAAALQATATAIHCSCGHGYGMHADAAACSGSTKRPLRSTSYNEGKGWEWVPCPCHVYDGPEPLPRSWSVPQILADPTLFGAPAALDGRLGPAHRD